MKGAQYDSLIAKQSHCNNIQPYNQEATTAVGYGQERHALKSGPVRTPGASNLHCFTTTTDLDKPCVATVPSD